MANSLALDRLTTSTIGGKSIPLSLLRSSITSSSLPHFIHRFWRYVEPVRPLIWNWHLDELCKVLEAARRGEIKRLIVTIPPGTMKPVHVDEPIYTKRGYIKLDDVVVGDYVLTHRGRFRKVLEVHDQGKIPTVRVDTFNGRSVITAPDHPFLTPDGWVEASNLQGRYIGTPRITSKTGTDHVTTEEARLLGYLVGDGSLSQKNITFTNADQDVLDDFIECAELLGFYAYILDRSLHRKAKIVVLRAGKDKEPSHHLSRLTLWLKKHGLYRSTSYSKTIPQLVLSSTQEVIRNFIGAYWSCDGMFSIRHSGNKTTMMGSATTVSDRLADDLLRALSLININCRKRTKQRKLETKSQPGSMYRYFDIVTSERNEVAKFQDMPGLCTRKNRLASMAFRDRFEPSIYADYVVSVTKECNRKCKCLTVEEDESFTVNNLIVHNSLLVSVFFHAWWWSSEAGLKVLTASYNPDNTIRDNLKVKSIVKSEDYQSTYWKPKNISISSTQDGKERFDTTLGGYRIASSVKGTFTGEHPDLIILDDLLKAQDAASPVKTEEATDFLSTTLSTRLALDPIIILVMQRLNDRDPAAYLMAKGGWELVCFPMRYESRRVDENDPRIIPDPRDHRTIEGELLWPEVWDEEKVQEEENLLGPLASGQLQQYPIPAGGALFKREYFPIVDASPVDAERVRGWDVAETDEEEALKRKKKSLGDETWGVRVSRASDGILYVEDAVWEKVCLTDKLIKQVAEVDGRKVKIREGSGSGKAVIKARSILLQGWDYDASPETESKTARANNFLSQCRAGNVRMVRGDWNEPYLNRVCAFPFGRYDDPVDATSNAANELMGVEVKRKKRATWGRKRR